MSLGIDEDDLPDGYRRVYEGSNYAQIQRFDYSEKNGGWKFMLNGNATQPRVDELAIGGHQLTFNYKFGTREFEVPVKDYEAGNSLVVLNVLTRHGISCTQNDALHIGRFIVAWINLLRQRGAQREATLKPFGWNYSTDGKRAGFAVAGDYYRSDGTKEFVAGGDAKIAAMYRPAGNYAEWRAAAALFEHGRGDLQALIATAFASPLIGLCGDVKGMSMNFWSTESGIGKTTAIRLGQSVWGDPIGMSSMTDTPNAVMKSLSELRSLTRFWDELRIVPSWQERFVEMIYVIPQGREKARMQADTTLREVGEWECFLTFTANRSMADLLVMNNDGTDSGLQRLFEVHMPKVQTGYDPAVGPIIKKLENNYGHAGRLYAAWLGEHSAEAENSLISVMQSLTADLAMQQEERFFMVAIACDMVGAAIARKLKIFDFDIKAIYAVLKDAFLKMRHNRLNGAVMISASGGLDLEELLGRYMVDAADYRVRTNTLSRQGGAGVRVTADPARQTVKLQIAEQPGMLRLSSSHFKDWLNDKNLPAQTVMEQIVTDLGAIRGRQTIGGGTKYAAGQIWCLDIPLVGSLAAHLNPDASTGRMAPGASVAAP